MITERRNQNLCLNFVEKIPRKHWKNPDFDSMVTRAEFIRSKCSERKVSYPKRKRPPFSFVMLKNKSDIVSVSSDSAVFEPNLYGKMGFVHEKLGPRRGILRRKNRVQTWSSPCLWKRRSVFARLFGFFLPWLGWNENTPTTTQLF